MAWHEVLQQQIGDLNFEVMNGKMETCFPTLHMP